jgi:gluconolactonase
MVDCALKKTNHSLKSIIGDYQIEKVASGFQFTEGPVWIPDGFLLFSDIPENTIFKWEPGSEADVFLTPSGHSNGLTLDREGRLLICEHDRRVSRLEKDGSKVTIAEFYEGKRLNSPNDIVVRTDGIIFFTDLHLDFQTKLMGRSLILVGYFD